MRLKIVEVENEDKDEDEEKDSPGRQSPDSSCPAPAWPRQGHQTQ